MKLFSEVVDAADNLSIDEQQTLIEILRRRVAEHRREILKQGVQEARQEFAKGGCRPASAKEIMDEVQS